MKNAVKVIIATGIVLMSACGGLENTVDVAETKGTKLADGRYEIVVQVDCVGGGFLSSDNCEDSEVCVTATWSNSKDEALESAETCKKLIDVGRTPFTIVSEKALEDAQSVSIDLEVKNDALSVFDFDKESYPAENK